MKISLSWLQEFVDIKNIDPQEIAKKLTLSTVEVEGVRRLGEGLEHIVVGKITKIEKHPNADKLNVCTVDVGRKNLNIVCGGSNVREGTKVVLAQIGAKVRWHGQGDLVELQPVEIRGVASEGMICASDEIGLADIFPKKEEKEILDLSHLDAKQGEPVAAALGLDDVIFEIDNKSLSNRPDLWGHYGIAREVAALFKKPLRPYQTKAIEKSKKQGTRVTVIVDVQEKKLCPRYMAAVIDGVDVGSSPLWLQSRLRAVGVRPINTIVDITNYVMMEVGQPMHAFDHSKFKIQNSKQIVVRRAGTGERLLALDGKEYELTKDMLVIADTENSIAIAGVMGGEDSGVTEKTHTIIFESANFDPVSIRRTSTALGLRSESSARFEKGLSPDRAELALKKAVELTLALCPGARVVSSVVDKKVMTKKRLPLTMTPEDIEKKLGVRIPATEIATILTRLGFEVRKKKSSFHVTVPLWRTKDITIPEDVIEEIVRVYGYDKIPTTLPTFPIAPPSPNPLRILERRVRELLAYEHGFTEVYNYSFLSPEWITRVGLDPVNHLELDNPIAKDRPLLRRTLKPGLVENIESNLHRYSSVKLFEIGRTYLGELLEDGLPQQPTMLGIAYAEQGQETPFFTISHALRTVFARLGTDVHYEKSDTIGSLYHPGRSAFVVIAGKKVGSIGELHPAVAKRLGIGARVAIAEVALTAIGPFVKDVSSYHPIGAYPAVTRDIACIVDQITQHEKIVAAIRAVDPLIVRVELFDVFIGGSVPEDKKSMAYHIVYQSAERTLSALEVEDIHRRVSNKLSETMGAVIRTE